MPFQKERYPANWKEISLQIREREGWACKWCGVKNGAVGARDIHGVWHDQSQIDGMNSDVGFALFGDDYPRITKIVLTVAHLGIAHPDGTPGDKHNKMDVRPENLAALCQKCHLGYDMDEHKANAAATRLRKKQAQYVPMFDEV